MAWISKDPLLENASKLGQIKLVQLYQSTKTLPENTAHGMLIKIDTLTEILSHYEIIWPTPKQAPLIRAFEDLSLLSSSSEKPTYNERIIYATFDKINEGLLKNFFTL